MNEAEKRKAVEQLITDLPNIVERRRQEAARVGEYSPTLGEILEVAATLPSPEEFFGGTVDQSQKRVTGLDVVLGEGTVE